MKLIIISVKLSLKTVPKGQDLRLKLNWKIQDVPRIHQSKTFNGLKSYTNNEIDQNLCEVVIENCVKESKIITEDAVEIQDMSLIHESTNIR